MQVGTPRREVVWEDEESKGRISISSRWRCHLRNEVKSHMGQCLLAGTVDKQGQATGWSLPRSLLPPPNHWCCVLGSCYWGVSCYPPTPPLICSEPVLGSRSPSFWALSDPSSHASLTPGPLPQPHSLMSSARLFRGSTLQGQAGLCVTNTVSGPHSIDKKNIAPS